MLLVIHHVPAAPDALTCALRVPDIGVVTCAAWDANRPPEDLLRHATALMISVKAPVPVITWARRMQPSVPVLVVVNSAAELECCGDLADDFLFSTANPEEVSARLLRITVSQRMLKNVKVRLTEEFALSQLIGRGPAFLECVRTVPQIAAADAPLLITGETGTGKELFARAVHQVGRRAQRPFIPVDCAALPEHLFENELFGHVRGAYTDAANVQKGLVSLAEGGTLFLDEVDSLSLAAQAKLLRLIQERTYRPLGSDQFVAADVNLISASNREMDDCIRQGSFRRDLFYRLNVLRLHLQALRERPGDICLLATHFLNSADPAKCFTPAALAKLEAYDWPGNVRELQNIVRRAALLSQTRRIAPSDIALPGLRTPDDPVPCMRQAKAQAMAAFESRYVKELLDLCDGNISQAARAARKERRAFGRLVQKYKLKAAG